MPVDLAASPAGLLSGMRGAIEHTRLGYPEVLLLDVRDERGRLWRFMTQDAEWSPADPAELAGAAITDVDLGTTGALSFSLSDGRRLVVEPGVPEADDDPPYWELISPDGMFLEFGPGACWQIGDAYANPLQPSLPRP